MTTRRSWGRCICSGVGISRGRGMSCGRIRRRSVLCERAWRSSVTTSWCWAWVW
ncbi:hypothetical protein L210DRAFT_3536776 [Boletus edulis BED1]|uniref:Uncharacterized protein n=1 Tax=Boletus edulis BED1 TaxID=1328754 RepID=A0AAD4BYN1_BOLED|nr:hypothetical protein L210DRAFT_3536776 [Boletus edulis BED1]